ncbi:hypothetical protein ED733_002514 [Metarhizium rileyi]|uniref:Carboxylic ester hydrolase n=1 Tax=Metarhizium rileyi (strain RCEF 4871) TaxID=1649241 RepID=A0A5C6G5C2_METRR|nr:hypothetical protein ED733_002514 [Metarhizium rileyi]
MGNTLSYNLEEHIVDLGPRGKIKGLQYDNKARRYAAVPYALPPTGEHRWRKPRPLPPSFAYSSPNQAFDATELRAPASQEDRELSTGRVRTESGGIKGTEDCLYVNIWTPVPRDAASGEAWPVMIWLHGGWFQVGDACHDPSSDPTELISTGGLNAIVVAVSYRLNIFGFLSSRAFSEESDGEVAGNFGLWDQRLALEWVYENIGAFGGDVNNMTISGRSAGSYGVEAQMLHDFRRQHNPHAGKLFCRAWMSSNAIPAQPRTVEEAEAQFDEVCQHFHIPLSSPGPQKISQLRQLGEADVLKCIRHLKNHTFRPVTDDLFLHAGMVDYIQSGAFARLFQLRRMKLLIGEVANEETLYAQFNGPTEPTLESLQHQAQNYYSPATTAKILAQYTLPSSDNLDDWKRAFGKIIADGQDIWRYRIGYRLGFIDESVAPVNFGVSHGMDGPLWNYSINQLPSAEEREMLDRWIKILVAFVNGEQSFDLGTNAIDELKVLTAEMDVRIEKDARYNELCTLGAIFSQGR